MIDCGGGGGGSPNSLGWAPRSGAQGRRGLPAVAPPPGAPGSEPASLELANPAKEGSRRRQEEGGAGGLDRTPGRGVSSTPQHLRAQGTKGCAPLQLGPLGEVQRNRLGQRSGTPGGGVLPSAHTATATDSHWGWVLGLQREALGIGLRPVRELAPETPSLGIIDRLRGAQDASFIQIWESRCGNLAPGTLGPWLLGTVPGKPTGLHPSFLSWKAPTSLGVPLS